MERIYASWQTHIAEAASGSTLPAAFLAALTANESGGNPSASCFERSAYRHLVAVASGQEPAFGSIGRSNLLAALQYDFVPQAESGSERRAAAASASEFLPSTSAKEEKGLRELATSWGLTQIMGYQLVGRKAAIRDLLDPQFHYRFAVELLTEFARRFRLKLGRDFEALFRCWNTGHPEGETFDPDYAARGIRRMQLYQELVGASQAAASLDGAGPGEGKVSNA